MLEAVAFTRGANFMAAGREPNNYFLSVTWINPLRSGFGLYVRPSTDHLGYCPYLELATWLLSLPSIGHLVIVLIQQEPGLIIFNGQPPRHNDKSINYDA